MANSEDWFRSLFDHAPDAIVIVDDAGTISAMNRQAEELFLYSADQLVGQPVEVLIPAPARDVHRGHRQGFAKQPHVRRMGEGQNLSALRADGSEFAAEISLSPVDSGDGHAVCAAIRDVTDRRRMELEIIQSREEAERAHKANQAFLAAASHDLRQPVQALTLLNGALRRTVTDEKALTMIENQDRSLTAMTNLLNSLLDISRLDAGVIEPAPVAFPVQQLFDRFSAEFSRLAGQKGLTFVAEPTDVAIETDPDLLGEILQNLVSNAIRYTESGSVTMRCLSVGDAHAIEVEDTGIGIEDSEREAIFEAFHQSHARGRSNEGFGLGLAIVQRLCALLDAVVEVQSTPGEGSTFRVVIASEAVPMPAPDNRSQAEPSNVSAMAGTVLLAEDDPAVADAWQLLLEAEGYTVHRVDSLAAARACLRELASPPELIISDYHLVDGPTGIDVVRAIREHFAAAIPAFIVSGDTSKLEGAAADLEHCDVLGKPVNPAELLSLAADAIRS